MKRRNNMLGYIQFYVRDYSSQTCNRCGALIANHHVPLAWHREWHEEQDEWREGHE